jgi:hypothetical protein
VMDRMRTQWREGFNGPIGLVYEALPTVFEWMGVPADERAGLWDDVRMMENAQLDHYAKQRAQAQQH